MSKPFTLIILFLTAPVFPIFAQSSRTQSLHPESIKWAKIRTFSLEKNPFYQWRAGLEKRYNSEKAPLVLLQKYLPDARKGDIHALFLAGLCALKNDYGSQTEMWSSRKRRTQEVLELIENNLKFPTNYECVRLRFLLEQSARGYYLRNRQLLPIARMLLKKQPDDLPVEREYGWLLVSVGDLVSTSDARVYFRSMVRKYPSEEAIFKSMLATSYMSIPSRQSDAKSVDKELTLRREILASYKKRPSTIRNREIILINNQLMKRAEKFKMNLKNASG